MLGLDPQEDRILDSLCILTVNEMLRLLFRGLLSLSTNRIEEQPMFSSICDRHSPISSESRAVSRGSW
jgi:hypothetical protein